jgi:hypothetical protein
MDTRETSEIRLALARCRAEEHEARAIRTAFEAGHMARLVRDPDTACSYRLPGRRNAWLWGWLEADQVLSEAEAPRSMSPEERAKGLDALAVLRGSLPFLGESDADPVD